MHDISRDVPLRRSPRWSSVALERWCDKSLARGVFTRAVVVIDEVAFMSCVQSIVFGDIGRVFATITAQPASPVIVDVVEVFDIYDIVFPASTVETAAPAVVMSQQVVMVGSW